MFINTQIHCRCCEEAAVLGTVVLNHTISISTQEIAMYILRVNDLRYLKMRPLSFSNDVCQSKWAGLCFSSKQLQQQKHFWCNTIV